jgi:hypothetical protein
MLPKRNSITYKFYQNDGKIVQNENDLLLDVGFACYFFWTG